MKSADKLHLRANGLELTVLPARGALVSSIIRANKELLYLSQNFDKRASSWPDGGMALLFPFSGRVYKDEVAGEYAIGDKNYHMPIHGFAYGLEWDVKNASSSLVELQLASNEVTRSLYPWDFVADYNISLDDKCIDLELSVTNLGGLGHQHPLPLYPGLHPFFNVDHGLFELNISDIESKYDVTPAGKVGKRREFPEQITFSGADEESSNSIISHKTASKVSFKSDGVNFTLSSENAKYTVLWSGSKQDYQCVEPWSGLPDAITYTRLGLPDQGRHPFSCQTVAQGESSSHRFRMMFAN